MPLEFSDIINIIAYEITLRKIDTHILNWKKHLLYSTLLKTTKFQKAQNNIMIDKISNACVTWVLSYYHCVGAWSYLRSVVSEVPRFFYVHIFNTFRGQKDGKHLAKPSKRKEREKTYFMNGLLVEADVILF